MANSAKGIKLSQIQEQYHYLDEDGSEIWEVEEILDKKFDAKDKRCKYRVKWKGWAKEDSTWEPLENLTSVYELVEKYENAFKVFGKIQKNSRKKIQKGAGKKK